MSFSGMAMSNTEQSLDEDTFFPKVDESSPQFLYCEREREAVEKLLSAGPEAFYSSVGAEHSGCFLSSEEVSQLTSWVQSYHLKEPQVQQENGVESSTEMEDFCSSYFPCLSDLPAPNLDLGWPNKTSWALTGNVTVHTSPPAQGEPSVREIIRRHLQTARELIAIVTDRLTDGAIIGDLHSAASRGVPIYIILNQRSIQENFSLNRLRHPNMRVRVLGGRNFCSRNGRMVVGEMKEKFLLVDLETVIHGSYSLTWTDAHLHRQLITVVKGPLVDSFDKEFRILFADSLPVPDTWSTTVSHVNVPHQLKDFSALRFQKQISLDPEVIDPPSPHTDSPLDWEAMGVFPRDPSLPASPLYHHGEIMMQEMPLESSMPFDKNTAIMDGFTNNQNHFVDKKRIYENISPVATEVIEKSATFKNTEPLSVEPATLERTKRMEYRTKRDTSRQQTIERSTSLHARNTTRPDDETTEPIHRLSSIKRWTNTILEEEGRKEDIIPKVENKPSSRKPIILRMPRTESFSTMSDIMKKIQQSSSGLLKRDSKTALNQSMMDLSTQGIATSHDKKGTPVPRFIRTSYDPDHMTPALALMEKRNDKVKSSLMPRERPRSSTLLTMDWRKKGEGARGKHE